MLGASIAPNRCWGAHLGTTTKAGSYANRNAGFIRQAGEWHWGCRINPAFRWWCQDAPVAGSPNLYPGLRMSPLAGEHGGSAAIFDVFMHLSLIVPPFKN